VGEQIQAVLAWQFRWRWLNRRPTTACNRWNLAAGQAVFQHGLGDRAAADAAHADGEDVVHHISHLSLKGEFVVLTRR
jgi:hypothetical protein